MTSIQDVPTQGPVTLIYTFGRATVSSSDVKDVEEPLPELPVDASEAPSPPDSGVAAPDLGGDSGAPALQPGGEMVALPVDQPIPGVAPELPTDDETGTAGTPDRPRSLGFLPAGAPTGNNNALVYLALVLAGAGVLVGQQLFSRFGIQLLLRT